jgi:penicillin-binding protein 1A
VTDTIKHLSAFGFEPDDLPHTETLALGSASLTPLSVARGFATFANGGFLIDPYLIARIEDSQGNVIFKANPAIACQQCIDDIAASSIVKPNAVDKQNSSNLSVKQISNDQSEDILQQGTQPLAPSIISPQNAFLINQALNSAIWGADWSTEPGWQGTGWRAKSLKRKDIAGKTGTTNESKDAWFSGFNKDLVTTSWIGFDDPKYMLGKTLYNSNLGRNQTTGKEFGAKSAQPAWIDFMQVALANIEPQTLVPPLDIVSVRIDKATGKLTTKTDRSSRLEYFRVGNVPTEYVNKNNVDQVLSGEKQEQIEELF